MRPPPLAETTLSRLFLVVGSFITLSVGWMMAAEPNEVQPALADEIAPLSFLVGTWDIESEFRLPSGQWERSRANSVIEPILQGRVLEERLHGLRQGRPFSARAMYGRSSVTGRLQRAWMDVEHGMIALHEGSQADDRIVLDLEIELRGRIHRLRHEFFKITTDSFSFLSRRSTDGGLTWNDTW